MKGETKRGMITEVIYLLAVIGLVSSLLLLKVIPVEKSWIFICFFLFLIAPLREDYWINFRLFTWRELEEISFAYLFFGGYSCDNRNYHLLNSGLLPH